jgi:predicted RNase H-like HicB family nuclease
MIYAIQLEQGPDGVGAYVPDVPGVGVVGDDVFDAVALLDKALQWHLEALLLAGQPIPEPTTDPSQFGWGLIPDTFILNVDVAFRQMVSFHRNSISFSSPPYRFDIPEIILAQVENDGVASVRQYA